MNVHNSRAVEKMAVPSYSNGYSLQENGFNIKAVMWEKEGTICPAGVYHMPVMKQFLPSREVCWERQTEPAL